MKNKTAYTILKLNVKIRVNYVDNQNNPSLFIQI